MEAVSEGLERLGEAPQSAHRGAGAQAASKHAGALGVLAVQGSFALHVRALERMGVGPVREVRRRSDLEGLSRLILPGGESTVLSHFLEQERFGEALCARVRAGTLAVLGTCAGAILLGRAPAGKQPAGETASGDGKRAWRAREPRRLALAPIEVERNAYGRQRDSFRAPIRFAAGARAALGEGARAPFEAIFIRAPRFRLPPDWPPGLEVLAWLEDDEPVLVRFGRVLLASFHPELTADSRVHRLLLRL